MHTSRYADIMSVRILMAAMYEAVKGAIPACSKNAGTACGTR